MKNLVLLNQPLDLKLIDFDEERKNSNENCDVKIMKDTGIGRLGIQELQTIRRTAFDSRVTQRNYAIASISCATRSHPRFCHSRFEVWDESQEAKIESQKAEMRPSKRFRFNTGPLNNWYEVNLNSIQGVHVDDSISTSISSVSRVTEPAISHPAQAGSDPELSQPKKHQCRKQYQCRLQLLVRHQRTIRKFHCSTSIHLFLRLLY